MNPHDLGSHAREVSLIEHIEHLGIGQELVQCLTEQYMRLQSISQMVRIMCQSAEEGDFDTLSRLFEERGRLITTVADIQTRVRPRIPDGECRRQLNALFAPMIKAIENGDEVLLKALHAKKEFIIEKSKEAQMQRLVAKYSE